MIIPISYPLKSTDPLYPGTPPVTIVQEKSIASGDSSNTSRISFSSHSGTHLDFPYHFCMEGIPGQDYFPGISEIFPVYCIDLPVLKIREIVPADLQGRIENCANAAGLFIRTGWWEKRGAERDEYSSKHPWISPELPSYIRQMCPNLSLFGLDQISISSPLHREAGREAHRQFLCHFKPVLLLEDCDLHDSRLISGSFILHLFPLLHGNADGIPVVAIMEKTL